MAMKPIELIIRAKDEASSVFDGLKGKLATIGAALAGYFGIQAFAGAVKGAAELEAKLSEVAAVSGASADDLERLRTAAEQAGATTKYTATEAADALGNLSRAGLTAAQAIEALPPTLQLAQAGGVDLAQASEFVTKAVQGMGLSFADAGRVADVLATGANASNTSVTGLAQALSYAAPTAKTLGLSLEDTVAIVGKFADAGIDASRAGTALNSILSQFSDPASSFKRALSDIGITTTDFNAALGQLADAGPRGQKAIAAVGLEAGPALKALLNQGIGSLNELRTKLQESAGSAQQTADIMGNNLQGAFKGLGSAWDTLKNALATPVLPVLKAGVESLTASFQDAVQSGVVAKFGAAIATGFEAAITWAKAFAAQVDFAALGEQMRGYATQAGEAFDTIKNAATTAGDVVRLVWGTMSAGTNAVLAGVYTVGEAFAGVTNDIQEALALLMEGISKITFGNVSKGFKIAADQMIESAKATDAVTQAMAAKAAAALQRMADGAQTARNGWTGLTTDSTTAASTLTSTVSPVIKQTAADLEAMGNKATVAGEKAKTAAEKTAEAHRDQQAWVKALRAEYEAAVATGNWQQAAEKLVQLKASATGAAGEVKAIGTEGQKSADAVAAAFAGMGIKTKDELEQAAKLAKTRFELIKESGKATADGLASAFKTMAEAAIAANDESALAYVKSQAAANGYKLEVDELGNISLVNLKKSTDNLNGSLNKNVAAYSAAAAAAREWAQAQTTAGAAARAAKLSDEDLEGDLSGDKYGNRPGGLPARNAALSEDYRRRKAKGQDAEGFSVDPKTGKRYEATGTSTADMLQKLQAMGYDTSDAAAQQAAASVAKRVTDAMNAYTGVGFSGQGLVQTPEQLLQEAMAGSYRANAVGVAGGAPGGNSARAATPSAATTAAKTYNVQLGGYTAKFDSDADAQGFIGELKKAKLAA